MGVELKALSKSEELLGSVDGYIDQHDLRHDLQYRRSPITDQNQP